MKPRVSINSCAPHNAHAANRRCKLGAGQLQRQRCYSRSQTHRDCSRRTPKLRHRRQDRAHNCFCRKEPRLLDIISCPSIELKETGRSHAGEGLFLYLRRETLVVHPTLGSKAAKATKETSVGTLRILFPPFNRAPTRTTIVLQTCVRNLCRDRYCILDAANLVFQSPPRQTHDFDTRSGCPTARRIRRPDRARSPSMSPSNMTYRML